MAAGVINLQKESGGIVKISPADGTGVTELVVPESGNLVSVDTAVTDNSIARYDGTTGKLQNSGVIVDDSGNVGVKGITPIQGAGDIQLGNVTSIGFQGQYGYIWANVKYTDGYRYVTSAKATAFDMANGGFIWRTAPSGTAGSPITWTDAMTLGANGNLLIGTSTDNGVDKLQVNGTLKATGAWNQLGDLILYNHYVVLTGGVAFSLDFTLLGDSSYDIEIIKSAHDRASQYNRIIFTQMVGIGQYKVISNDSACTVTLVSSAVGGYRYTVTISSTGTYNGYTVHAKQRSVAINSIS